MCKLAVQQNLLSLKFVKQEFITEEMCKLAVQQNLLSLKFVKQEFITEEMCKLAVIEEICKLDYFIIRSVYNWYMFFLIIKKNIK